MGTLWWGVFNDFLAYLRRVANGCVLRSRLFVCLAVLEWTSTSCLGRFSHSLCRWARRQTRPARRLSKEDFCRTEL